jgi:hypothetical protein
VHSGQKVSALKSEGATGTEMKVAQGGEKLVHSKEYGWV